jgi:hypothetical protein
VSARMKVAGEKLSYLSAASWNDNAHRVLRFQN